VQLQDVAIGDAVFRPHPLAVEGAAAPQARKLEGAGNVLMHEPRDIEHGLAATYRERQYSLGGPAGQLRVHAYDAQRLEEEPRELVEAMTGQC
jgi:hypothetical protein